jgi:hypothetical protein
VECQRAAYGATIISDEVMTGPLQEEKESLHDFFFFFFFKEGTWCMQLQKQVPLLCIFS